MLHRARRAMFPLGCPVWRHEVGTRKGQLLIASGIRLSVFGLSARSGTTLDRALTYFCVSANWLLFTDRLISALWRLRSYRNIMSLFSMLVLIPKKFHEKETCFLAKPMRRPGALSIPGLLYSFSKPELRDVTKT